MNDKSLQFSRVASAIAAGGAVIGFINLQNAITGVAALVTFVAAVYFSLRKPDPI
jgi:hypothetical protein